MTCCHGMYEEDPQVVFTLCVSSRICFPLSCKSRRGSCRYVSFLCNIVAFISRPNLGSLYPLPDQTDFESFGIELGHCKSRSESFSSRV